MAEETTEKQHHASAKRILDLRKQGQVMRSRDLISGIIFIVSIIMLFYMAKYFKLQMEQNFTWSFSHFKELITAPEFSGSFLRKVAVDNFMLLTPIFAIVLIVTGVSPFLFGGWNFTLEPLQFNFNKINPINYFKRMFSKHLFFEVFRSMLKFLVIFSALILFVMQKNKDISSLIYLPVRSAIGAGVVIAEEFIFVLAVSLIIIVAFDVIYHYFEFQNKIKMTTHELKEEHKETEGSPEVKRKLRSAQLAILKQRLNISVPQATVVVTNPTHYAIALRYDPDKDNAPKVMAKGKGHIAHQIKMLAISHAIAIYQAPTLARAIYHTANIGTEIHPDLYMAVAIVLSYVQQLKNYQQGLGQQPNFVSDLNIPNEFVYDD